MTVGSYFLPRSLPEALDLLERHGPELLVMAGGTVAMPLINEGISLPEAVMGLRMAGLDRLERVDGTLRIGATATLTQLLNQTDVPMLSEAARNTASWSIRNMATVGGNLFTPPPGGDVAVALLALDASVTLASPRGERVLPLADFFTGFLTNQLAPDELLVELQVPIPSEPTAFIKFGRKHANTPAVVTVAVACNGTTPGSPTRASPWAPSGLIPSGPGRPNDCWSGPAWGRTPSPQRPPQPPRNANRSRTASPPNGIGEGWSASSSAGRWSGWPGAQEEGR